MLLSTIGEGYLMEQYTGSVKDCMQCMLVIQTLEKMQKDDLLTEDELENARQLAYKRYGFKDEEDFLWGPYYKKVQEKIWTPAPEEVNISPSKNVNELNSVPLLQYVSLTEIAKQAIKESAAYVIHSWLRSNNTLEFLALWEKQHNPSFDEEGYQRLMQKRKGVAITPAQWIKETKSIGITSKRGNNGGTSAHIVIACDFMMWLSAEFRLHLLETMQILKKL